MAEQPRTALHFVLRVKPARLFLKLEGNYVVKAVRAADMTYSHAERVLGFMVLSGLLKKFREGRTVKYEYTLKGLQVKDCLQKLLGVR